MVTRHGNKADRLSSEDSPRPTPSTNESRRDDEVNGYAAQIHGNADVLARCQLGEPLAWKELYAAHFEFVYRSAWRLGARADEIEDVCQEVFVVVFRKLSSFSDGRLTTWLYRIVANIVADRHRRSRRRETLFGLWGGDTATRAESAQPDRELEGKEAKAFVDDVLRRMADKKREVFVLFEIEGLPGEEIALRLGCKLDTVWSRLFYARRDFEKILKKKGYTP